MWLDGYAAGNDFALLLPRHFREDVVRFLEQARVDMFVERRKPVALVEDMPSFDVGAFVVGTKPVKVPNCQNRPSLRKHACHWRHICWRKLLAFWPVCLSSTQSSRLR